jgi:hypothetical protein
MASLGRMPLERKRQARSMVGAIQNGLARQIYPSDRMLVELANVQGQDGRMSITWCRAYR